MVKHDVEGSSKVFRVSEQRHDYTDQFWCTTLCGILARGLGLTCSLYLPGEFGNDRRKLGGAKSFEVSVENWHGTSM